MAGLAVAFGGQKGGAGKTTAATGLAVAAAQHGFTVLIGDLDQRQASAIEWGKRRLESGRDPKIDVRAMSPAVIGKMRELVDLVVLDLPGFADKMIAEVGRQVDLLVLVTDTNMLELEPTVDLLKALKNEGLESPRVVVALTKVRDKERAKDARLYLDSHGFPPLGATLPDYDSVHDIGNDGGAAPDIRQGEVAKHVKSFFNGIMSALERATQHLRVRPEPSKDHEREGRDR